jgi:hypothetical protein
MVKRPRGDEQAQPDEIGTDPGQVGPDSAGQSGDPQRLSSIEDANNQSVQELADSDQAMEAEIVEGVEDAADHPERPVHTHLEYGHPDDVPPSENGEELEDPDLSDDRIAPVRGESKDVDVEDLPDEEEDADRVA